MTTEPTHSAQERPDRVPFELVLSPNLNTLSKLTSTLLDTEMHAGGAIDVAFERGGRDVTTADDLDPFQVGSLVSYLTDQPGIRRSLEAALDRHHDEWHYPEVPRGSAVWRVVRVEVVAFEARKIVTRETAGISRKFFPGVPDEFVERRIANSDTADTRSKFMVFLAGPWTDGHQRLVYFRDGMIRSFSVEG